MSASLTSETESDFVCDCKEWMRSACAGEPFYREHEGRRYCVLHFPGKEKSADFEKTLQRKLENKDFNFRGVWFIDTMRFAVFEFGADAQFDGATFNTANFTAATFSAAASFGEAIFDGEVYFALSTFIGEANFNFATFSSPSYFAKVAFNAAVHFNKASFGSTASFLGSTFSAGADFSEVTFKATADFSAATFARDLSFRDAVFRDYIRFAGDEDRSLLTGITSLNLQSTKIERPEHVSFHHLIVRPHWFVTVNTREFDFLNVRCRFTFSDEIESLHRRRIKFPYDRLSRTFRDLAINNEERHRYKEASRFRYWAMETYRRERWGGLAFWRLSWWYWLASGYGERILRAFLVLLGIWFVAGLLYNRVGFARWEPKLASEADIVVAKRDDVGAPLKFSRALTYSAAVMTFQKPEPRPATTAAQTVVLLETVLGPVQAALLALAIRRKFMR